MNILIAADSFKGSCPARQVTDTIERAAKNVIPDVTITKIPVADGGEGTVDALVAAMRGTKVSVPAHDPLGRPITAEYGLLPDGSAVIETAAASGLTLLKPEERDALHASTFGTGELIRHALEHRVKKIILGLGGSATTDGGAGLAGDLHGWAFEGSRRMRVFGCLRCKKSPLRSPRSSCRVRTSERG